MTRVVVAFLERRVHHQHIQVQALPDVGGDLVAHPGNHLARVPPERDDPHRYILVQGCDDPHRYILVQE